MRRIIAVATLGVALFAIAACADVPQDKPGANPSPSTTGATVLADKKASCAAYKALETETMTKVTPIVLELSAAKADPAKADPVKVFSSLNELKTIASGYEAKLTPIAVQAGDAQVKAGLEAELTDVRKVRSDFDAAGVDQAKLQALADGFDWQPGKRLASLCA